MALQKFHASGGTFTWPNGAIGHRPGGPFDCIGPYAQVRNCPVMLDGADTGLRLTCYASAVADTFFSIPAATQYRGKYIRGYFSADDSGVTFNASGAYRARLSALLPPKV